MTAEQKVAYVVAMSVAAYAEIEAMKALNREREAQAKALAYDEGSFLSVIDKYGLHHNALLTLFQGE